MGKQEHQVQISQFVLTCRVKKSVINQALSPNALQRLVKTLKFIQLLLLNNFHLDPQENPR